MSIQVETQYYRDFGLDFLFNPLTGALGKKVNLEAIRQSLKNISNFVPYDIPFDPDVNANLKQFLFEPADQTTESVIYTSLKYAFEKYEPRIKIINIDTTLSDTLDAYKITLTYQIKSLKINDTFSFLLERTR